ncbi:MAG: alanine racemase [Leptospiraceae bacterium]|nr:alanine racemase [Leptospiraceae bacterium]MCP5510899.1 alanine racemase [Leptospiraceae bacterium]
MKTSNTQDSKGNWIEISRSALQANITQFRNLLNPSTKFAAIIKSNAYGHGILEIAKLSLESGVDVLGVNSLEEVKILRDHFPKTEILLMGETSSPETFERLFSDPFLWVVTSHPSRVKFYSSLNPRPKIHLKTDTGMGRLGNSGEMLESILTGLKEENLPLDGLMTHFASTEDFTEHSYTLSQLNRFHRILTRARELGYENLIRHSASSASTLLFEEAHLDMVRIGISLYGLWPSLQTRLSLSLMGRDISLHPVLAWKSRIVHIQDLPTGSMVGYGSTFKTNYPTRMGVIPVGYYEGLDRRLSNQGYVLISGERAPIIGRICMNMAMLDITHIEGVDVGTEVTILGRSGKEEISADLHASLTGTINYDITTRLQKDIPRIVVD